MENFKVKIIVMELMTEKEKMLAGKLYDANPLSNWDWREDCFVVCPTSWTKG